jgi:hypothetical protein
MRMAQAQLTAVSLKLDRHSQAVKRVKRVIMEKSKESRKKKNEEGISWTMKLSDYVTLKVLHE